MGNPACGAEFILVRMGCESGNFFLRLGVRKILHASVFGCDEQPGYAAWAGSGLAQGWLRAGQPRRLSLRGSSSWPARPLERQFGGYLEGARAAGTEDSARGADWLAEGRSERGISAVGDEYVEKSRVVRVARAEDITFVEKVKDLPDGLQVEAFGETKLA